MKKGIIEAARPSSGRYEVLEEMVRLKVQEYIQEILEEEVEAFLGRKKSERINPIDGTPWVLERARQAEEIHRDEWDDHRSAAACKGHRRTIRKQDHSFFQTPVERSRAIFAGAILTRLGQRGL